MTDQLTSRGAFVRDDNSVPITGMGLISSKAITYAAGTTGATGAKTIFSITGVVAMQVFGYCSVDLTSGGSATIEVGIAGNAAAAIAQTTATTIDAGEFWYDVTPVTVGLTPAQIVVAADIIQTIGTTTVTGGTMTYYCMWYPISEDGNVTAA